MKGNCVGSMASGIKLRDALQVDFAVAAFAATVHRVERCCVDPMVLQNNPDFLTFIERKLHAMAS